MKTFEIYKNIRKQAVIFGLSISLFALMMVTILASLLVIIFSFSFEIIIGLFIINAALYIVLTKIHNTPQVFHMKKAFPTIISNKRNSGIDYEQD
ncbi:membrane protein [Gillisia limnaea DSM 15749]|uniref:Membrane protein n=1 Tax=Gillisia limnaea (strain DSM 15749 / LMG 21470 / R-8282) TaxID=865937 RepID=H2BXV1_GILLR|nr:hypothetical protein [Gillisia limnaea]EHQ02111.1 membrane protein [Gillisia limnaea DSM 15749]EHQ02114.1 membrane protein [Gillisia limnaea DSM 15749]